MHNAPPVAGDRDLTGLERPRIDHVVANVRDGLDAAAAAWRRLGFALTPRGHHTLGSSNHLAILGTDYIELLGFEEGRSGFRPELMIHPLGLAGLVFKTADSDGLHAELVRRGVEAEAPRAFSRPVEFADGVGDAAFRTVRLAPDAVPNGRAFFCHHLTPGLVWRDEWRGHANGATGIAAFVVVTPDPARSTRLYEAVFGAEAFEGTPGGRALRTASADVLFLTPDAAGSRFGDRLPAIVEGEERMAALVLRTRSLAAARAALEAGGVASVVADGGLQVAAADAAGVALAFVEGAEPAP